MSRVLKIIRDHDDILQFPLGYFHSYIMSVLVIVLSLKPFERVLPVAAYVGGDT